MLRLIPLLFFLMSCGGNPRTIEEGPILITYTRHGDFAEGVMSEAARLLPSLSRPVTFAPVKSSPNLEVLLSLDGFTKGRAGICELRGQVKITPMNLNGDDRFAAAVYAVLHEVGHMLGARHGQGVMASDVLAKAVYGPTWSPESIQQIESCIGEK